VDGESVDQTTVQVDVELVDGLVLERFLWEGPMHNGAVGLDGGQVDQGRRGDFEAEESREIFERFAEDLIGSIDEPGRRESER
jgi:hypothetical protein